MTDMERKTFFAALSRYGGRVDGDTLANIAEEIADVGSMLDQMAIEFKGEDAVAEQRVYKVQRRRNRSEHVE